MREERLCGSREGREGGDGVSAKCLRRTKEGVAGGNCMKGMESIREGVVNRGGTELKGKMGEPMSVKQYLQYRSRQCTA